MIKRTVRIEFRVKIKKIFIKLQNFFIFFLYNCYQKDEWVTIKKRERDKYELKKKSSKNNFKSVAGSSFFFDSDCFDIVYGDEQQSKFNTEPGNGDLYGSER